MDSKLHVMPNFKPGRWERAAATLLREVVPLVVAMSAVVSISAVALVDLAQYSATHLAIWTTLVAWIVFLYRASMLVSYKGLLKRMTDKINQVRHETVLGMNKDLEAREQALAQGQRELEAEKADLKAQEQRLLDVMNWCKEQQLRLPPGAPSEFAEVLNTIYNYFNCDPTVLDGKFMTTQELQGQADRVSALEKRLVEQDEQFRSNLATYEEALALQLAEWIKQIWETKSGGNANQLLRALRVEMCVYLHRRFGSDSRAWQCVEFLGATADVEVEA